jgi:hypothetical protein
VANLFGDRRQGGAFDQVRTDFPGQGQGAHTHGGDRFAFDYPRQHAPKNHSHSVNGRVDLIGFLGLED